MNNVDHLKFYDCAWHILDYYRVGLFSSSSSIFLAKNNVTAQFWFPDMVNFFLSIYWSSVSNDETFLVKRKGGGVGVEEGGKVTYIFKLCPIEKE